MLLFSPLHPIALLSKISLHACKKLIPKKQIAKIPLAYHTFPELGVKTPDEFNDSLKGGSNESRGEHISHANPPTKAKNHKKKHSTGTLHTLSASITNT